MRLAIISDIHGNLLALEAVLADIRTRAVDGTVNLGDLAAGPLWPAETVALLDTLGLPTVRGNHDRWMGDRPPDKLPPAARFEHAALSAAQRAALHALPPTVEVTPEVLAVHGTPADDSTYLTEESHDDRLMPARRALIVERLGAAMARQVVLCGHSHRQSLTQVPGGPLILNPGTVGCPVFADLPTAKRAEHRSPHARYAVLTRRQGRWGAELLAIAYDWDAAAARARANGFPAWAEALATGAVAE
jgi:predicted phosphodiesterase